MQSFCPLGELEETASQVETRPEGTNGQDADQDITRPKALRSVV